MTVGADLQTCVWFITVACTQEDASGDGADMSPISCANYGDDDYVCLGAYRVFVLPLKDDGSPDHQSARWDQQNAQKLS